MNELTFRNLVKKGESDTVEFKTSFDKEANMTREDIAITLSKSPNTIKEHIAKLKSEGRIKRIGSDRSGYWEVILTD